MSLLVVVVSQLKLLEIRKITEDKNKEKSCDLWPIIFLTVELIIIPKNKH